MDKHKAFMIGLILLALFVIAAGIGVILTPPLEDEPQALALVAIGFFMLIIGYDISQRQTS